MATKDWKNQTSITQKRYGGMQFINSKKDTQIAISKWDFNKSPKNWAFYVNSIKEARRGYPSQKLGITKSSALRYLKAYMRAH